MARYRQLNDLDVPDDFVLPEGDVRRGQLLFKKHCAQCHTIRRDGLNPYGTLYGPNLYGIMGRAAARNQQTGWQTYSANLEASGILWTERNMMAFLKNPKAFAGGSINMNFRGIESTQDRVDLIHYLQRAGHESWMVKDGTPHSQKGWWNRTGSGGSSYWQVNASDKQLTPMQHLWRGGSRKVNEFKDNVMNKLGYSPSFSSTSGTTSGWAADQLKDDPEVKMWRQVEKVSDGVRPASMQRSFNWPPREVITQGPVSGGPKAATASAPASDDANAGAPAHPAAQLRSAEEYTAPSGLQVYREQRPQPAAPPAAAPATKPVPLQVGEQRPSLAEHGHCTVAPSGLLVYRERPTLPAACPAAKPPAAPEATEETPGLGLPQPAL